MVYLPSRKYMQIAWVVPDLDAAIGHWVRQAGVGPFFYFDDVVYEDAVYRGEPWQPVKFHAAIAQAGDMQIELISQLEEGPSMFREVVPAGQIGSVGDLIFPRVEGDDHLRRLRMMPPDRLRQGRPDRRGGVGRGEILGLGHDGQDAGAGTRPDREQTGVVADQGDGALRQVTGQSGVLGRPDD